MLYVLAAMAVLPLLIALPIGAKIALASGESPRLTLFAGPLRVGYRAGVGLCPGKGLCLLLDGRSSRISLPLFPQQKEAGRQTSRAPKYLLRHVKIRRLSMDAVFSLPDAAATARLSGLAIALLQTWKALRPRLPISGRVRPDFSFDPARSPVRGWFVGIFYCRLGHIMAAALLSGLDKRARRP